MNSIISDINNEIKEHLKLNIEKSVLKSLEEKLSNSDPLDCLKALVNLLINIFQILI